MDRSGGRARHSGDLIAALSGRNLAHNLHSDVLAWHFELGPEVSFLQSLAEVRIGIEIEAAALAAERRTEEQAKLLMAAVDRMASASTPEEFARHDLEFHKAVADASANPFMASISALVEMALTAAFTISSPVNEPEALTQTVAVHRAIAQAIVDKSSQGAREAMRIAIAEGFARAAGRMESVDP